MLLTTKFLRPAADVRAVHRTRLLRLLEPEQPKRLNLVVAPAGYGKTTLVSQWCAGLADRVAWLALDEHDDVPRRFWHYVAGAIAHDGAEPMADVIALIQTYPDNELDGAVTALLNTLAQSPDARILVLDDFHVIKDPQILRQLAYFIDYLPPQITVTVTSRVEPALPVPRWRVRRWVCDIHPQLLAFSETECRNFFRHYMGIALSDDAIKQVWRDTEGWVAAMQLSALSGREMDPQSKSLSSPLTVDERKISDYVLSEILDQQPTDVARFLMDTACPPRLCASLCDSIRVSQDSQHYLERLLKDNLFLIPLDSDHHWFRYHDLFREALLQKARQQDPERVEALQIKGIEWLLGHNHIQESIAQLVDRKDWPWLAQVLEQHGNNLIHAGFHLPVLDWLQKLPTPLMRSSPQLMMLRIWGLFFANRLDRIEPELTELENELDRRVADSHPDAEGALGLGSEMSLIRSYLARSRSDEKSATDLTQQVLRDIDHTRIPLKSVTYYGLGLDYFGKGELTAAEDALRSSVQHGQFERKPSTVLSSGGLLAWIQCSRGDIDQALETSSEIRGWVDQHYYDPQQPRLISCWQNSVMVEIYRERNDQQLAEAYLVPLLEHLQSGTEPGQHVIIQYVRGHLAFSEGRFEAAIEALDDAAATAGQRHCHIVFEPPASGALLLRCYLALEDRSRVLAWLKRCDELPSTSPLPRTQNELSAGRALVYLGKPALAKQRLNALLTETTETVSVRQHVEARLILAACELAEGDYAGALAILSEALTRGEAAGFLRLFLDEGLPIRQAMLETDVMHSPGRWTSTLRQLLLACTEPMGTSIAGTGAVALVEALSQREQEVLQLIHEGLANKEIAIRMDVAGATVKAHIRNLYGKLAVSSRTEALAKARQVGLL
ncbi:LuxR C-terminal-related transcriptional regulator [Marinobacter sp. SS21]|uniref:LuxR C-terminal-related transcriptional regulator n=1 Tax=Marinobacter sp. SS21 TaxID=2979460 RepID=UPI00232EF61E|nr:LuxR C-terminal-related transcriptional regulator [Marinobacter sp. SS21]MDC0661898.1 LuxR C-terminal-related transcriptional regulator [Marinobacter sp. SS21]